MPFTWTVTWDGDTDNFVVDPDQVNAVELLAGNVG